MHDPTVLDAVAGDDQGTAALPPSMQQREKESSQRGYPGAYGSIGDASWMEWRAGAEQTKARTSGLRECTTSESETPRTELDGAGLLTDA